MMSTSRQTERKSDRIGTLTNKRKAQDQGERDNKRARRSLRPRAVKPKDALVSPRTEDPKPLPKPKKPTPKKTELSTNPKILYPYALQDFARKTSRFLNKEITERNFLDLGSGRGAALEFFKAEGFQVKGVEKEREYFEGTKTQQDVIEADLSIPNKLWLKELIKPNLVILINNKVFDPQAKANMEYYILEIALPGTWIVTTSPSFQCTRDVLLEGINLCFEDRVFPPKATDYNEWGGAFSMYYYCIHRKVSIPFPKDLVVYKKKELKMLLVPWLSGQLTTKGSWTNFCCGVTSENRKLVLDAFNAWFEKATTPKKKLPPVSQF